MNRDCIYGSSLGLDEAGNKRFAVFEALMQAHLSFLFLARRFYSTTVSADRDYNTLVEIVGRGGPAAGEAFA